MAGTCPHCGGDHAPDQYQVGYFIEGTSKAPKVRKVSGEPEAMAYSRDNKLVVYWDVDNLMFGLAQTMVSRFDEVTGAPKPDQAEKAKLDKLLVEVA